MDKKVPTPLTPTREKKFRKVVKSRQPNITVILENVYDSHNVGAVMRSCDSIGIGEIFVLYTDTKKENLVIGKRPSAGSKKWMDVHFYTDREACFKHIRSKYDTIVATHLGKSAKSIYDIDLSDSVALLFGNEHAGVSDESLKYADTNMVIPQVGMTSSLNISVACAVTLYEAYRQRMVKGYYTENPLLSEQEQIELYDTFLERSRKKGFNSKNEAKWRFREL
jgi:tRNA (guanosine-2'-O-)-methyltransferase